MRERESGRKKVSFDVDLVLSGCLFYHQQSVLSRCVFTFHQSVLKCVFV